jgi:hypothetical protein
MKKLQLKLSKWLLKRLGYKFVAVKAAEGYLDIQGDKFFLKYVDVVGFTFNKQPMKRNSDIQWEGPTVFEKRSPERVGANESTTEPFLEEIKKQNEN